MASEARNVEAEFRKMSDYSALDQNDAAIMLLLNIIWNLIAVPTTWLSANITCLFKKGSKGLAKNYRSIFVRSTISRILPIITLNRLGNTYEHLLMKNQFGFRKNRFTTYAIFIVREAIQSTKDPIYLCMIDLRAAYDHIDRNMLFKVLSIRTKAFMLTSILKALYTGTIAAIKNTVDHFQVHTGCRQGGIESPVLFNIYMDFVLRCAEHEVLEKFPSTGLKYAYRIKSESTTREQRVHGISGHGRLCMLLYADDIVLFCEDVYELQSITNIYDDATFSRFGLTIACDKTKTMSFNVSKEIMQKETLISLKNEPIGNVRQFKYLGHVLSNQKSNTSAFLTHQISRSYAKWNEMKNVLLDKRIHLSTGVRFLEACVISRLLYSVQAWSLNAKEMQKIESIWHGLLRRLVKGGFKRQNAPKDKNDNSIPQEEINWAYKISNKRFTQITKTVGVKEFCVKQHLKYIAHVTRLGNDSLQKQFLFCKSNSNCGRWRKLSSAIGIDESQLRKTMTDKKEFMQLLDHVF